MKNHEFFKDEILDILATYTAIVDGEPTNCNGANCADCIFNTDGGCKTSREKMRKWLYAEHKEKIKITAFDKDFLDLLSEDFSYIARDADGALWVFTEKPVNDKKVGGSGWYVFGTKDAAEIPHVFDDFPEIKWEDEEPTNIEDFLKNCEVIS